MTPLLSSGTWYFITVTDNQGSINFYIDGSQAGGATITSPSNQQFGSIGACAVGGYGCGTSYFNGFISNVQVYQSALSANSVESLYVEGIGGVPIDLQDIIGWWPLNGNVNDYSGNGNNGGATNIYYANRWWDGYKTP